MKCFEAMLLCCLAPLAAAWDRQLTLPNYNLSWNIGSDNISFQISAATTGWVGLGLSPNGGMAGADIIIAWIANGSVFVEDRYALLNGMPLKDNSQDIEIVGGSEANGITTVSFRRKLDTKDMQYDRVIKSDTTRLIYAFGTSDPKDNILRASDQHQSNANHGSVSVYLLDKTTADISWPNDTQTYEFSKQVLLPNDSTIYMCSMMRSPNLTSKVHVIGAEPVITRGNEMLVHHILVYECFGPSLEQEAMFERYLNTSQLCMLAAKPEYTEYCGTIVFGWAVGGSEFRYPAGVGYPIGDKTAPKYFMLEVHYSNTDQLSDISDSSGLRVYYTKQLRQHDAGILGMGSVMGIFVPPKASAFDAHGYCSGNCTHEWIPEGGIKVFAYTLHSHLLGVAITVRWFRHGKELEPFASDANYDFNYQEHRLFKEEKTILPGDTLQVTCTYDSSKRTSMTWGGLGTPEEMCLAYIVYYPRQDVSECQTIPSYLFDNQSPIWTRLKLTPKGITNPEYVYYPYETLNAVNWSKAAIDTAAMAYRDTPQIMLCGQAGRITYQSHLKRFYPIMQDKGSEAHAISSSIIVAFLGHLALLTV